MINVPLCSIISVFNNARVSKHNRMRGYVAIHKTIGCNKHIVTYCDFSHNCRIDTYPNIIAYSWSTFQLTSVLLSNHNAFMQITIATDYCLRVDCNVISMTKISPPPICVIGLISRPLEEAISLKKTRYTNLKTVLLVVCTFLRK